MKKIVFLLLLFSFIFYAPKVYSFDKEVVRNFSYFNILDIDDYSDLTDGYNQEQNCEGSDSLLGDPNDENSVAWLLQQVLNFIKIVGPVLVVILSSIEYIKVITSGDTDAMHKSNKKLINRLILAGLLLFIPIIVEALLDVFGFTSTVTCGLS